MQPPIKQSARLLQLTGMRGLLALWVLFGHACLYLGSNYPFLKNPGIAVDLFMVLSGLFIASTFDSLQRRYDYAQAVRYFWIRRVLRIWPLYAVMLTLCWLFIDQLDAWMQLTAATFPRATADAAGYVVPRYQLPDLRDALLHYSMLFGLLPASATSTPLPDWSLSLEFQFYLLFPLLYLLLRSRLLLLCIVAACAAYLSMPLLGFYQEPGRWAHFHQPSLLTYKLNLFLVGVFLNSALKTTTNQDRRSLGRLAVGMVICLAVAGFLTTLGIGMILYLLLRPESRLSQLLSLPIPIFFGEISYTIYLVHQPILLAMGGTLATHAGFVALPPFVRFSLASIGLLIFTTLVSWVLYLAIERPGIRLGHRLTINDVPGAALSSQSAS